MHACVYVRFSFDLSSLFRGRYKMLQVNVGTLVYPEYKVDVSHPLFRSTEHFEEYVYWSGVHQLVCIM